MIMEHLWNDMGTGNLSIWRETAQGISCSSQVSHWAWTDLALQFVWSDNKVRELNCPTT